MRFFVCSIIGIMSCIRYNKFYMPPKTSQGIAPKVINKKTNLETQNNRYHIEPLPNVLEKYKPVLIETYTDDYPSVMLSLKSFLKQQSEVSIPKGVMNILDILILTLEQPIAFKDVFDSDRNTRSEFKKSFPVSSEEYIIFSKQRINSGAKAGIAYLNFFLESIDNSSYLKFKTALEELYQTYGLTDINIDDIKSSNEYNALEFEKKIQFIIALSDIYFEVILDLLKEQGLDWVR